MKIALDTNMLIYVDVSTEPERRSISIDLLESIPAERVVIPAQVLAEYVRVLLRKLGYPPNETRQLLSVWLSTYATVDTSAAIVLSATDLATAHHVSFWDAVILSSAAAAGCRILLSEDIRQDFTWAGVTVVNPFAVPRHHLLDDSLTGEPSQAHPPRTIGRVEMPWCVVEGVVSENPAGPVVIGITSPPEPEYVEQIRAAAPGQIEVRYEPDLLPPPLYRNDHHGPDDWQRPPEQQARWEAMLAECEVVWDIPEVVWDTPGAESRPVLELMPKLRWIQTTSAGVGPMIKRLGLADTDILVTTASGVHAKPLAEFAFAVMLHWVKEFPRLREEQLARGWERYCSGELDGRTLTVVGPGRIGRGVGRLGKAFGMHTIAIASHVNAGRAAELGFDEAFDRSGLHDVLGRSDFVVFATPHTPDTENLIDASAISAMKPGIVLVNIARGIVVDEDAMIEALQSGQIAYAGLDVFRTEPLPADSPLWELPNVLIAPHSASTSWSENQRITDIFVRNIPLFLAERYGEMDPLLDKQRGY